MSELTDTPAVPPLPDNPPAAGRRWPHPLVTGLAGLVVGAGVVGLVWGLSGGGSSAPKTFTLRGSMTLNSGATTATFDSPGDCVGYEGGGMNDIAPGAAVTVYDSSGKVLATGSLGNGKLPGSGGSVPCTFPVMVPDVPEGSKFYQVEISHRGKVTVSSAEAKAGGFASSLG